MKVQKIGGYHPVSTHKKGETRRTTSIEKKKIEGLKGDIEAIIRRELGS